jgi:hypothetical protein
MTRTTVGADPGTEIITLENLKVPHPTILGKFVPLQIQVPKMTPEREAEIKEIADRAKASASSFIDAMQGFLTPKESGK